MELLKLTCGSKENKAYIHRSKKETTGEIDVIYSLELLVCLNCTLFSQQEQTFQYNAILVQNVVYIFNIHGHVHISALLLID